LYISHSQNLNATIYLIVVYIINEIYWIWKKYPFIHLFKIKEI